MSDTPRTDKFFGDWIPTQPHAFYDFARQLERERHQVETKLSDALVENAKLWDTVKHDSDRMQHMMLKLSAAGIDPA